MKSKLFAKFASLVIAGSMLLLFPTLEAAPKKDNGGGPPSIPPGQGGKKDDSGSGGDTGSGSGGSGGDTGSGSGGSSGTGGDTGGSTDSGGSGTSTSDKGNSGGGNGNSGGGGSSGGNGNGGGGKGATVVSGSNDPKNPTVYHFSSDFTMSNNVIIQGHAKIVADGGFNFKNSELQIGPNSSLSMFVKGPVSLQGNGEINTLAPPASFMIYGTGGLGQTIGVVGTAGISAVVYAPDADFSIKGTSGIFGAVIANSISNNGQGSSNKSFNGFIYDKALKDLSPIDDTLTMEDYGIVNQNDHLGDDDANSTFKEFFSQF